MERSEKATSHFLSGCNCAQSVLLSYADDLQYSEELAKRISAGFGGGMGKQQETCGAITGAIMVLGMMKGEQGNKNDELQTFTYDLVKELLDRFKVDHGTTRCMDLIGCDLNTPEGSAKFKDEQIKEKKCVNFIETSVKIVESLIL